MLTEQNLSEQRCAVLAKRIVALRPDWAFPGCRIATARTGNYYAWRMCDDGWTDDDGGGRNEISDPALWDKAVANGPEFDDPATIGALLMICLPEHELTRFADGWRCVEGQARGPHYWTREEAILNAVVAKLEQDTAAVGNANA